MRTKLMVGTLVVGLTAALAAPAGAGGNRTVTYKYNGFNRTEAGPVTVISGCISVDTFDCIIGTPAVRVGKNERFVTATFKDQVASQVGGSIWYKRGGQAYEEKVCGKTEQKIRVKPGSLINFYLSPAQCGGPETTPTTGTVTLTFSR